MNTMLDKAKIRTDVPLEIFQTLDSTNDYLLHYARYDTQICLAETQTAGRGREDRAWYSPLAENIYFSLRIPLKKFTGLSIITSLAVIKTLKQFAPEAKFFAKWPNDIIYNNKKLAGCLIEIQHNTHAIIGIGLNVNMQHNLWASLKDITHADMDRNEVCTVLIRTLADYIQEFEQKPFENFIPEWNSVDYLAGKNITIQNKKGIMNGINKNGNLILELESGKIQEIFSGEASTSLIK
ncbi:MAG: biotin--[acetyl-CoA-carboxylase] ligase [Gammaproteobacteria bacterium]|nr:biotin--[acetyl-CoA-carboxylase] ligase [Gammaproteobacteria bacterium]